MIYKLTVLQQIHEWPIGSIIYIRDNEVSYDGLHWHMPSFEDIYILEKIGNEDIIKSEESDIEDTRHFLSEIIGCKLYSLQKAFDKLGWTYEEFEDKSGAKEIKCCGKDVDIFTDDTGEVILNGKCNNCNKSFQNMSMPIEHTQQEIIIDPSTYQIDDDYSVYYIFNSKEIDIFDDKN